MEKLYDENQLAEVLGCTTSKLQRERWLGRGVPFLKLGRHVRYRESDLQEYLDKHRIETWK